MCAIDLNIFLFFVVILYRSHFYHSLIRRQSVHISGPYFSPQMPQTHYSTSKHGRQKDTFFVFKDEPPVSLLFMIVVYIL